MKKQAFNPYLPLSEYIPDVEPYVFDGRLYIYGSHDLAGGEKYCPGDYMSWSAPIDDLGNWTCHGVSYRKTQDPTNKEGKKELWAPDVAKGNDGKYYIYYCLAFVPEIGVAVSDTPTGPFEFYGHIKYPENILAGKELNEHFPFDPGVLVDDNGKVYLYYGFSPAFELTPPSPESFEEKGEEAPDFSKIVFSEGAMVVELESDMLTMKDEPKLMVPGGKISEGTGFEGHAFFEASSMRKVNAKYYFVYSSQLSHELCYATSDSPDKGFTFGGTIISNGDIGFKGNEKPVNMMGNNHGSIIKINEEWFIFYHRHTHGTESSRQGCAEKIQILPDGSIPQVEITSCGLNGGPLLGNGVYSSAIACYLTGNTDMSKIVYGNSLKEVQPYIFEEDEELHYIANIGDEVKIGYKYFDIKEVSKMTLNIRGKAEGKITVILDSIDGESVGEAEVSLSSEEWIQTDISVKISKGIHAIYFSYYGKGSFQFKEFILQ